MILAGSRPIVDRCVPVHVALWKRSGVSRATIVDVLALRRSLRRTACQTSVDLQGSIRSAVISRLSGAPERVGSRHPRETAARLLYTRTAASKATHVVEQACDLLGAAADAELVPATVELPRHPGAELWAAAQTAAQRAPVLLAPTAGWGAKEWPPERFGEVAAALAQAGHAVLINAAPGQDATAQRVLETCGGVARIVRCTLEQLIALVRVCRLVIAGDTGPLHLAAALQVPVVGLFGPTDPARTGPWAVRSVVLRDGSSVTDHRRHAHTESGLFRIGVAQVVSAALEMLDRG